jgi:hypothetical protein
MTMWLFARICLRQLTLATTITEAVKATQLVRALDTAPTRVAVQATTITRGYHVCPSTGVSQTMAIAAPMPRVPSRDQTLVYALAKQGFILRTEA